MVEIIRRSEKKSVDTENTEVAENDNDPMQDNELLKEILKPLVAKPEKISISEQVGSAGLTILTVCVDEEDIPKIIGRQGKMIKSIQHYFQGVGAADGRRIMIQIGNTNPKPLQRKRSRNYGVFEGQDSNMFREP